MRTRSRFLSGPRGALIPAALSGLLALAGCAGGGGGPGVPDNTPVVPFAYPPSLAAATSTDTVDGVISPYALNNSNPATPSLVSVLPSVFGTTPSAGIIAITVGDIALPSPPGAFEPGFVVTFNSTSGGPLPISISSPLDSVGCVGCLVTADALATYSVTGLPAGTVTFTFVNPASASFTLNYSTLGMWSKPITSSPDWQQIGGAFSAGVVTRGIDLPTTGTADYAGYFIGRYATSDATLVYPTGTYIVGANANASADFGTNFVTFFTSNTHIAPESGGPAVVSAPGLNLTSAPMSVTRTSTSNSFAGTVGTGGNVLSGPIQGAFYGAPAPTAPFAPPEAGGSLAVTNNLNQSMVGSFALKKQ